MPFDMAPQETQTEVGRFQKFADAMLRGCAVTEACVGVNVRREGDTLYACAIGAMHIGLGVPESEVDRAGMRLTDAEKFYMRTYGRHVEGDNDSGRFTREQIAARIAAL